MMGLERKIKEIKNKCKKSTVSKWKEEIIVNDSLNTMNKKQVEEEFKQNMQNIEPQIKAPEIISDQKIEDLNLVSNLNVQIDQYRNEINDLQSEIKYRLKKELLLKNKINELEKKKINLEQQIKEHIKLLNNLKIIINEWNNNKSFWKKTRDLITKLQQLLDEYEKTNLH